MLRVGARSGRAVKEPHMRASGKPRIVVERPSLAGQPLAVHHVVRVHARDEGAVQ